MIVYWIVAVCLILNLVNPPAALVHRRMEI